MPPRLERYTVAAPLQPRPSLLFPGSTSWGGALCDNIDHESADSGIVSEVGINAVAVGMPPFTMQERMRTRADAALMALPIVADINAHLTVRRACNRQLLKLA
jgi:hypothetical protein